MLGAANPSTLETMANMASLCRDEGKYAQAESLFARVLAERKRLLGTGHPVTLHTMGSFAALDLKVGKYAHADLLLREALSAFEKTSARTWDRYNCESLLGASLSAQKRYAEAEPLLLSGYAGLHERESRASFARRTDLTRAAESIVQLSKNWGKPGQAAEWENKLQTGAPERRAP